MTIRVAHPQYYIEKPNVESYCLNMTIVVLVFGCLSAFKCAASSDVRGFVKQKFKKNSD